MKKMFIILLIGISTLLSGCKCCGHCSDNKPVSPNTYSSEKGDEGDPVLPPMDLWWK